MLAQSLTAHSTWRAVPDAGRRHQARACRRTATAARSSSTYPTCGVECAKDIEELIQTTTTGQIAGFLAEPIQGVGGFITPPNGVLQDRRRHRQEVRRRLHLRRGADGLRPHRRQDVGHRALRRRARHHDDGQGHRQRAAARRLRRDARDRRLAGRPRTSRPSAATRSPAPRPTRRSTIIEEEDLPGNADDDGQGPARRPRGAEDEATRRRSATCAAWASCRRSSSSRTRRRATARPTRRMTNRVFEETKKRGLLIGKGGLYGNVIRIAPAAQRRTRRHRGGPRDHPRVVRGGRGVLGQAGLRRRARCK